MRHARTLFLFASLLTALQLRAQKFQHSIGIDIRFSGEKIINSSVAYLSGWLSKSSYTRLTRAGLSYFPRYVFLPGNRLSFSMGMPITLGIGSASSENSYMYIPDSGPFKPYGNENRSTRFAAEIPAVADINLRLISTAKTRDYLVLFLGGGYAYNHAECKVKTDMYTDIYHIDVWQPYFHGGISVGDKKAVTLAATFRPARQYGKEPASPGWGIQLGRRL
jgi:hypothetical protein